MDPKLRPGSSACLCPSCGTYYTSDSGFQKHRVGTYPNTVCQDPATTLKRNGKPAFKLNSKGLWATA